MLIKRGYDDMNTKKAKNMAITSLVMLGVMLLITIAFIILFKVAGKQIEEETDNFTSYFFALLGVMGVFGGLAVISIGVLSIVYLVVYIIAIVEANKLETRKERNLLIIGLLVPVCNIVGLAMLLHKAKKLESLE